MAGSGLAETGRTDAETEARGAPSRTLVVCCDGTWNDPEDQTNVWRTFVFLRDHCGVPPAEPDPETGSIAFASETTIDLPDGSEASVPIFAYYDKGVGERSGGGAFGVGLGDNVRQAYAFVARNWRPNASIFIFGFSRGAYTARSLAGMLGSVGVVDAGDQSALDAVWAHYRLQPDERTASRKAVIDGLQQPGARRGTPVRFLGVWDTVGSLGVPVPQLRGLEQQALRRHLPLSRHGPGQERAERLPGAGDPREARRLQAGALDQAARVRSWTRRARRRGSDCCRSGSPAATVTSAAATRAIGGLADISLTWMLRRALESGHPLKEVAWQPHCEPSALGARNNSLTGSWRFAAGNRSDAANSLLQQLPVVGKLIIFRARLARRSQRAARDRRRDRHR